MTVQAPTPEAQTDTVWLTIQQAARRVSVSDRTLRREIASGRLRVARVGGRRCIRLRPEWVDQWLLTSTTPVETAAA